MNPIEILWEINPKIVLYWLLATFLFWFLFANLMRIKDRRLNYTKKQWQYWGWSLVGYPVLIFGYPYDILYNLTYGTVMFWQPPRRWEWTFTARLQRLVKDKGWRGMEARFICKYLVEPWDKNHCGEY